MFCAQGSSIKLHVPEQRSSRVRTENRFAFEANLSMKTVGESSKLAESTVGAVGIAAPSSAEVKSVTPGTQPEQQSTKNFDRHTPGPWTVAPVWPSGPGFVVNAPTKDHWVCGLNAASPTAVHAAFTDAEAMANAHLIAAAPDLLETVRNLVALAEQAGRLDRYAEALADARVLIAKAEGR